MENQLYNLNNSILSLTDSIRNIPSEVNNSNTDKLLNGINEEEQNIQSFIGALIIFILGFLTFYNLQPIIRRLLSNQGQTISNV